MREIKFRVWDSISTAYHYWGNIQNNKFNDFDLDHYTLEQFTGLKDKNGVDIYEGDIVTTRTLSDELNDLSFKNYQVGFFECTFCLIKNDQAIRQWKDGTHDWYSLENTESFEIEVIGNIHEQ